MAEEVVLAAALAYQGAFNSVVQTGRPFAICAGRLAPLVGLVVKA